MDLHYYSNYKGPLVVCDTNVWYGTKNDNFPKNVKLASTWLSVFEIFTSNNIKNHLTRAFYGWERLKQFSECLIPLSPSQHFHRFINGFESNSAFQDFDSKVRTFENFNTKLNLLYTGNLDEESKNIFYKEIIYVQNLQRKSYQEWIEPISLFKKKFPITQEKKDFLKSDFGIQYHWQYVTKQLVFKQLGEQRKFIDTDSIFKMELFINVFNQYMIDLDLGKMSVTENDIYDIFNMVYVRPEDKYWTKETKWIKYITQIGLGDYLFEG